MKPLAKHSPFYLDLGEGLDIIGDIHGCLDEFLNLLDHLGYSQDNDGFYRHPDGRKVLSLGDIMSRGPYSLELMQLFEAHIQEDLFYMIDSNHGWKIARWLDGRPVTLAHGDEMVEAAFLDYEKEHGKQSTKDLKQRMKNMLLDAPSHYVIHHNDKPLAVVTHAGIKDHYIGKDSPKIRDFCRYGPVVGIQPNGKPKRGDWTHQHDNELLIIWGHDPRPGVATIRNTLNIDQGAVFGGELTAVRLPEREIVQVPSTDYAQAVINPLEEWAEKRLKPPYLPALMNGYTVTLTDGEQINVSKEAVQNALTHFSQHSIPLEQLVYLPSSEQKLAVLLFASESMAEKWTGFPDTCVVWDINGRKGTLKKEVLTQIRASIDFEGNALDWVLGEVYLPESNGNVTNEGFNVVATEQKIERIPTTETQREMLANEAIARFRQGQDVGRIHECILAAYTLRVKN